VGYYRLRMKVGPHSAAHVRLIIRAYLHMWRMRELLDAAQLAATELIANVARHVPDRRCELTMVRRPDGIRVEVADGSPELPKQREADLMAEDGRGLAMVALVADDWGTTPIPASRGGGKAVWFELRLPGGGEASGGSEGVARPVGAREREGAHMDG
jgi:hypothetical protein